MYLLVLFDLIETFTGTKNFKNISVESEAFLKLTWIAKY